MSVSGNFTRKQLPVATEGNNAWNFDIVPTNSESVPKASAEEDQRDAPTRTEAEMLLRALRNVIITLVQPACGPIQNDSIPVGREGEEFLNALQKFIARVIQPRSSRQAEITIGLEDSSLDTSSADAIAQIQDESNSSPTEAQAEEYDKETAENNSIEGNTDSETSDGEVILDGPEHPLQLTPLEKVREALRQHVFNAMPIRMLSFTATHNSQFIITLIERPAYFTHILPKLETGFDEAQFLSQFNVMKDRIGASTDAERAVIEHWVARFARYAILSHTWLRGPSGEVTYGEWHKGGLDANEPGFQKLVNFCRVAAADYGVTLGWMDTVCINKESSAELDESIRSMYKWYQKAYICITYLAETVDLADMHKDPWFSRGWTLQELLAPENMKFYGGEWKQLVEAPSDDKRDSDIQREIEMATTITNMELNYLRFASMFRRMQWAAMREVTREEDAAYSLMGIFGVSIAIAYGEGAQQAFLRLLKEILSSARDDVLEIFYWAGSYTGKISSLLPSSSKAYLHDAPNDSEGLGLGIPIEPLTLTHLGLRVPVLLLPAVTPHNPGAPYVPVGDYYATVDISVPIGDGDNRFTYNLLDSDISEAPGGLVHADGSKVAFGVLNFGGGENTVHIRKTCFAVALTYTEDSGRVKSLGSAYKMETKVPVVFQLRRLREDDAHDGGDNDPSSEEYHSYYTVPKNELAQHGIQLLNLYL